MPRRVSLPGAAELFRPTHDATGADAGPADDLPAADLKIDEAEPGGVDTGAVEMADGQAPEPTRHSGSGRIRHDEKITVYVSSEELLALEQARLMLRAEHKMAVDRGRIVREAIAIALADLADHHDDAELVRRLSQP